METPDAPALTPLTVATVAAGAGTIAVSAGMTVYKGC